MICCPHPDRTHHPCGQCVVRYCGCERAEGSARCACPYQDCWVTVSDPGEICAACLAICVKAREMEKP